MSPSFESNGQPESASRVSRQRAEAAWSDDGPNPFALVLESSEPSIKSRFFRAFKTMIATLALTSVLLAGVFFGKQFLLSRLVAGFDDLDSTGKQSRLVQIASFGVDAVEPLVDKLISDDDAVSESAFTLLQQMQNDWITLKPDAAKAVHGRLMSAIAATYHSHIGESTTLSPRQLARARELVRQTILEFSGSAGGERQTSDEVQSLLAGANRLMVALNVQPPANATLAKSGVKLMQNDQALEVSPTGRRSGWTDWPPPSNSTNASIVRSGSKLNAAAPSSDVPREKLQAVPEGVTVPLTQVEPRVIRSPSQVVSARPPVGQTITMTTHLVDSPLSALSDETVIRHLANPDAMLAGQAKAELIQRGFSDAQLEMAGAIALAGPLDRMRLVDSLVHSSRLNSGPWLSMLLDDPDRRVRLHVASTLATTLATGKDEAVLERLRQRLTREEDDYVAAKLRRILDLL
ncbi:HEAT repeat domain-containing protein [Aporhodopirellula aestuarii]|uniref:HEAT repeat domain-containing protein n=1 Tax=Aporhodopirellula aestuarii TaxID=2950107 RepID=A0ABT0UBI9_9BACT|nr:HEAT repeat domain-containing protein [Aporhodopirellula aestuarii]MCM2374283.1 HEAT repeat domain-containing protein [Aporhodopirellula aestuarii]